MEKWYSLCLRHCALNRLLTRTVLHLHSSSLFFIAGFPYYLLLLRYITPVSANLSLPMSFVFDICS